MVYEFNIVGQGGEAVIGTLTKSQYEYWADKEDDEGTLSHLFWDAYEEDDGNPITDPENELFLGPWYELDDIEHCNGAQLDMLEVTVTDEDGKVVYETEDPDNVLVDTLHIDDQEPGFYFRGWTLEKGNFYSAEIETDNFDPKLLKYHAVNMDGDVIVVSVEYNGNELDNDGGDTRGKASGCEFREVV